MREPLILALDVAGLVLITLGVWTTWGRGPGMITCGAAAVIVAWLADRES